MTWFFAIVVVALLGGVAVVATGRGGSMTEAYDDRPDALVPADGPLTASDLRSVRFTTAFRGYRMSEVDALLDRLAADLEPREQAVHPGPTVHPDPAAHPDPAVLPDLAEEPRPAADEHSQRSTGSTSVDGA